MILATILNAILAVSVMVMVITPLVWAILTQHRDHPGQQPRRARPAARQRTLNSPGAGHRHTSRPIQAT